MFYKFFDKTASQTVAGIIYEDQQLANELHKPLAKAFQMHEESSSYRDKIWGADLQDMQLISEYNNGVDYYCVLLIFTANMLRLFH